MHKRVSAFCAPSKRLRKMDLETQKKFHKSKLQQMKPTVDNDTPTSIKYVRKSISSKKMMLDLQRQEEIDHENLLLVTRMNNILRGKGKKTLDTDNKAIKLMENRARCNTRLHERLLKIDEENAGLFQRIKQCKPMYRKSSFAKEWKRNRDLSDSIREVPDRRVEKRVAKKRSKQYKLRQKFIIRNKRFIKKTLPPPITIETTNKANLKHSPISTSNGKSNAIRKPSRPSGSTPHSTLSSGNFRKHRLHRPNIDSPSTSTKDKPTESYNYYEVPILTFVENIHPKMIGKIRCEVGVVITESGVQVSVLEVASEETYVIQIGHLDALRLIHQDAAALDPVNHFKNLSNDPTKLLQTCYHLGKLLWFFSETSDTNSKLTLMLTSNTNRAKLNEKQEAVIPDTNQNEAVESSREDVGETIEEPTVEQAIVDDLPAGEEEEEEEEVADEAFVSLPEPKVQVVVEAVEDLPVADHSSDIVASQEEEVDTVEDDDEVHYSDDEDHADVNEDLEVINQDELLVMAEQQELLDQQEAVEIED